MKRTQIWRRTIAGTAMVALAATVVVVRQVRTAEPDRLADRLQQLEDREAIRRLIVEYGRALDDRDWPAFASLFAEDGGEWVGGMGSARGRTAIQTLMEETIGTSTQSNRASGTRGANLHVFTNETIRLNGDTATALTKWMFVVSGSDGRPQPLLLGHYVDTLVRERGEWRFQRRLAYGDIPPTEPKTSK
jgi:uncharacterized protein (TIGR02246 family)